jgi:hypothetical protein
LYQLFVLILSGLDEKLKPYLEMIDKVDASVTNLEEAAYKLDTYSKELGKVNLAHWLS